MTKILSDERVTLIRRAASRIRVDWSGMDFDGRDVDDWIRTALDGTDEEVSTLLKELHSMSTW
jgi:hypothetical protein